MISIVFWLSIFIMVCSVIFMWIGREKRDWRVANGIAVLGLALALAAVWAELP